MLLGSTRYIESAAELVRWDSGPHFSERQREREREKQIEYVEFECQCVLLVEEVNDSMLGLEWVNSSFTFLPF